MKILFQGDSITHAFRRPEEQNPAFQLGNGYAFLVAARLSLDFPREPLTFINRGVCGDGISALQARWEEDAVAHRPDLLSLLIGVNDTLNAMRGGPSPDTPAFLTIYRKLLDAIKREHPAVRLIVMEPFLLETDEVTSRWREHLKPRQEGIREISTKYDALFIPLQARFEQASHNGDAREWVWDGIHPTHRGFQLIADAWLEAVRPTLLPCL